MIWGQSLNLSGSQLTLQKETKPVKTGIFKSVELELTAFSSSADKYTTNKYSGYEKVDPFLVYTC